MHPGIDETVGLTSDKHWSIGSFMLCKGLSEGEEVPPDAVCSWNDDGTTYILKKRSVPRVDRHPEGDFLAGRYLDFHAVSRGVWILSPNVFCKVKGWVGGLTTEGDTIRWVNKNVPSIPTTNLIYEWVDAAWNRTIMLSHKAPGMMYDEAWPKLTEQQKLAVADQVAGHLKALSEHTSDHIETVTGGGARGCWSLRVREPIPA